MRVAALLLTLVAMTVSGRELTCIPRAEMGETTYGDHLYERDKTLQGKNLSRIDFQSLTVTSAEGKRSTIMKIEDGLYKTSGSGRPYYFVTNASRSIVTELTVGEDATYMKVLLCK